MGMNVSTLLSVEEYLSTSYSPDKEFRDGVLVERNVGDNAHAELQALLTAYLVNRRTKWGIRVYTELRVRVREKWYPLPDVCVYTLPAPEERYPTRSPLLWIEILSHDDKIMDVWNKAKELVENGVPYVWIIDPNTLESQLMTASGGPNQVPDRTLRLPDSSVVIPLLEVMEE
jgi:Uma2 family endonuclease